MQSQALVPGLHNAAVDVRPKSKKKVATAHQRTLVFTGGIKPVMEHEFCMWQPCRWKTLQDLNIIDDYNRESLAIEIDTSLPSQRVIRVLEKLVKTREKPKQFRVDNGPEFISNRLQNWCAERCIEVKFIQPCKPVQNCLCRTKQWFTQERTLGRLSVLYPYRSERHGRIMATRLQQLTTTPGAGVCPTARIH